MKIIAVLAPLAASFAAVEARVGGPRVAARVRVVGSDAGYCESYTSKVGCDADYALVVDEFQDGTVKGILHDKELNSTDPDENGSLGLRAAIDCLYIVVDEEDDNATIAIVTGNVTWGEYAGKESVATAAKKYPNGTGFYTGRALTSKNCTNPTIINYFTKNAPFFEHQKGSKVTIEVL
jgi:hypothetical protein